MKRIVVLLADGFEELEALAPIDLLRRAGVEVTLACITNDESKLVTSSHGVKFIADVSLSDYISSCMKLGFPDAVVVPGGLKGTKNLSQSGEVSGLLKTIYELDNYTHYLCAICAAPVVVLSPLGLLRNKSYTCYPDMENELEDYAGSEWKSLTQGSLHKKDSVVIDGNLVTSRGAGTACDFAFAIMELLCGKEKVDHVKTISVFNN